ncbi:hypothetical protein DACRYDRAFT_24182 [Dacryopinax primogenitus]|uniref:FUN34 transmembrane protein n=1 Tax=Dacryopinax primogenitus (strain DJM 731) TaxID=1858805 RepID=M5FT19_DACPD|nr:uncharacterized protein DACRYDRAFT_24182 [Dacryopinax primogenitus]EJT99133.1 hypothetical protein DACRYDRAFT_24182 [Dacryopinax primogenitus]
MALNIEKATPQNTVVSDAGPANAHLYNGANLGRTLTTETQPAFPIYHRRLGNPAPLGLWSFASTTLLLSLVNVSARNVTVPNIVVGMALGVGGLCQLLAGMWEFAAGNTFGATAFSSYGGFWLSFACIYLPDLGILDAYSGAAASQIPNAVGMYLMCWFIVTFLLFLGTFRASVALSAVFFFLFITFILLAAGEFTGEAAVHKAGGAFGIVTALVAYYTGAAGLYSPDTSYFILPIGDLPKLRD